jgi:hypothetical protein
LLSGDGAEALTDEGEPLRTFIGPQVVIVTEIITGRIWQSVVSADGVWCEVARVRRGGR